MFTSDEYEMMMRGLDAILAEKNQGRAMKALMGGLMKKDEEREEFIDTALSEGIEEQKVLEERIILLKAKLIRLRDEADVKDAVKEWK